MPRKPPSNNDERPAVRAAKRPKTKRRAKTPKSEPREGVDAAGAPAGGKRRPQAVIRRLSLYARQLHAIERNGVEKVSSRDLGERLGLNSAQVRKDLAAFGQFGVPGYGYNVSDLRAHIRRVLGADRKARLALIGVGNLGLALLSYGGFKRQGFEIVAAFDADKRKLGAKKGGVEIESIDTLEARLAELSVDIAILAVPVEAAQGVAEAAARSGVSAILNFVPTRLSVPEGIVVQDVDLSLEIESLAYSLNLK
jgi:redox-sensing transcriptional repressor